MGTPSVLPRPAPLMMISALLGGIGLFLLGMILLTEGLKSAAGAALRDLLSRFAGGPVQSFASGAALTAVVQSSSATVVMTIGFVSAGLLTFVQAIGVVFGAAVGTTSTSWFVAFLGLRYSVSVIALPLVGIGALMRLLGQRRSAAFGLVVAGFGLIFVGIDTLQVGMSALSDRLDLAAISGTSLAGRALLVGVGIATTVVMQSSSAAVATTLAALHSGTIDLPQAAALVIGQNMGTTITAALASIGASVPARRTALAHVFLNLASGVLALGLLPLHLVVLDRSMAWLGFDPAGAIALFHTAINLLGVGLILPFSDRYAEVISRLVVDRTPPLTRFLDASVLTVSNVAVEAARRTLIDTAAVVVGVAGSALGSGSLRREERDLLESATHAVADTRSFLGRIRSSPEDDREYNRHLAVLHAADHLDRLLEGLHDIPSGGLLQADATLSGVAQEAAESLEAAGEELGRGTISRASAERIEGVSRSIAERRRMHRPRVMAGTASGSVSPELGLRILDAMRWADRVVYHVWRVTHHLAPPGAGSPDRDRERLQERAASEDAESQGRIDTQPRPA